MADNDPNPYLSPATERQTVTNQRPISSRARSLLAYTIMVHLLIQWLGSTYYLTEMQFDASMGGGNSSPSIWGASREFQQQHPFWPIGVSFAVGLVRASLAK